MKKLMIRTLFCLSFVVSSLSVGAQFAFNIPDKSQNSYPVELTFHDNTLNGILVIENNYIINGLIMNEFAVTFVKFSVSGESRENIKIEYLNPLFDKLGVRKILKNELKFLFSTKESELCQIIHKKLICRLLSSETTILNLEDFKNKITIKLYL